MSRNEIITTNIQLSEWVKQAKSDTQVYQDRQAVEVLLTSIGMQDDLQQALFLKGGTLLALAFRSERVTADVDFSCLVEDHERFSADLKENLNNAMLLAATRLGYIDKLFVVQTVKKLPRPETFPGASFPAIKVTIAYADVGSRNEARLQKGTCPNTITIDISFKEQVYAFQELCLSEPTIAINAYSIVELAAEKFRAVLQQETRNRIRRQDIYDLYYLLSHQIIQKGDAPEILKIFKRKCATHNIKPEPESLRRPEILERSEKEWLTLADEIAGELPDFKKAYQVVRKFYEGMDWDRNE